MITELNYIKNPDEETKKVFAKAYKESVEESKLPLDSCENALVSQIRIMGYKFWESPEHDLCTISTQDEATFDREIIKQDVSLASMTSQFIAFIFQGFMEMNGNSEKFTKEFAETNKAFMSIITNKNIITSTLGLMDLASVADITNEIPSGIKNFEEIMKVTQDLSEVNASISKLTTVADKKTAQDFMEKKQKLVDTLKELHYSICDSFFKIVEGKIKEAGFEDSIKDVYDIEFGFKSEYTADDAPNGKYTKYSVAQLHSMNYRNIVTLKAKYGL